MSSPQVSVITPAYNGADYLGETIQSVLDQTYPNFELVIVSDASPDNTPEVVRGFDDPRILFIEHEENRGANVARNTGVRASSGEILVFLDQDDLLHPDKLRVHVDYLAQHPEVGFTYNGRFEFDGSPQSIRYVWQPPGTITLADMVLSTHLLSPTDMVIKRDWAFRVGLWDEDHPVIGSEIILTGRLWLAGCKFASVGRVLNYRRHHPGRMFRDLANKCRAELEARDKIFSDPHCPEEVLALRDTSFSNNYLAFAYLAFAQEETGPGQEFIREAARLNPTLLEGKPCSLVYHMLTSSIVDESRNYETLLQSIFAQLPPEMAYLSEQYDWALARGYLLKGTRDLIWKRIEQGQNHLARAAELGAQADESFLDALTHQLLNYEAVFGAAAAQSVLHNLALYLKPVATQVDVHRLQGHYSVNQAFRDYYAGKYLKVPSGVVRAVANDPRYLMNRGVLAMLFRSIGHTLRQFGQT